VVEDIQAVGVEDQQVTVMDVAASPALVPEPAPARPRDALRELRLALVCYGGVSLAIYMHGVTTEFEKLVAASVAYERDQDAHDFEKTDTAAMYWSLLKRLHEESNVRTRVVIDVIAGTSAGGINGVFLAAAIARNRSQEPLRAMWMDNGDIKRLLTGREGRSLWLKTPRIVWSLIKGIPLLDGKRISAWLGDALGEMEEDQAPIVKGVDSLLGPQERLQLFVPITDFYGYDVQIPADDPAFVEDRTHRHIMHFIHDHRDPAMDQLSSRWNAALAFSARATSSFPGAFPPLSITDFEASVKPSKFESEQRQVMFAPYTVTEFSPESTHFVDGGVLDNKPFASAVTVIKVRPAATEIDRRLVYVEPDPGTEPGGLPDGGTPGLVQTIIGGYAGIPRQEPILGDLTDLAVHNTNVDRIRDVIETNFDPVREKVRTHVESAGQHGDEAPTVDQVTSWRGALQHEAAAASGLSHSTYLRLRIRAVVDDFATLIAEHRGYPLTSSQALFIGRVLRQWAKDQQLFDKSAAGTDAQRRLIDALDLAHHERHVRFLIAALSWWYNPAPEDQGRVPNRASLDHAKHILYAQLDELNRLADLLTHDDRIRTLVDGIFGPRALKKGLSEQVERFVRSRSGELTEMQELVEAAIGPKLVALPAALDADVVALTESWTPWARIELLTRHLGFALWDVILYPIQAVSGVNERDHVEVMRISPHESRVLATPAQKDLKGVTLGHFGAFFSRPGRENDYLWGRLDTAERLIALLKTPAGESIDWIREEPNGDATRNQARLSFKADSKHAARLIVESERESLTQIGPRLEFVSEQASLPDTV